MRNKSKEEAYGHSVWEFLAIGSTPYSVAQQDLDLTGGPLASVIARAFCPPIAVFDSAPGEKVGTRRYSNISCYMGKGYPLGEEKKIACKNKNVRFGLAQFLLHQMEHRSKLLHFLASVSAIFYSNSWYTGTCSQRSCMCISARTKLLCCIFGLRVLSVTAFVKKTRASYLTFLRHVG